eukprot:tig00000215_g18548.t1
MINGVVYENAGASRELDPNQFVPTHMKGSILSKAVDTDGVFIVHRATDTTNLNVTVTHTYWIKEDLNKLQLYMDVTIVNNGPANADVPYYIRSFGVKLTSPFVNAYGTIAKDATTTADHLMGLWFDFKPRHNGVLVPAPADVAIVQALISGGDRTVGKDVPFLATAARISRSSVPRGKCPAAAVLVHEWRLVPQGEAFESPNALFKAGPSAELKTVSLSPSSATPNPIANFNPGISYTLHLKTVATCPDGTKAEDMTSVTISVLDKPLPVVKIDVR